MFRNTTAAAASPPAALRWLAHQAAWARMLIEAIRASDDCAGWLRWTSSPAPVSVLTPPRFLATPAAFDHHRRPEGGPANADVLIDFTAPKAPWPLAVCAELGREGPSLAPPVFTDAQRLNSTLCAAHRHHVSPNMRRGRERHTQAAANGCQGHPQVRH